MTADAYPRQRRRPPFWAVALFTVVFAVVGVWAVIAVWADRQPWPPFVAGGDALAIVLRRDGKLPAGAVARCGSHSGAMAVFGVREPEAQKRLLDAVREEIRTRGGRVRGYSYVDIQFMSGDPPAADARELPAGSAIVRTVKVQ